MNRLFPILCLLFTLSLAPAGPANATAEVEFIPVNTTIRDCGLRIQLSGTLRKVTIRTITDTGSIFATKYTYGSLRGTDEAGNVYRGTGVLRRIDVDTGNVYTITDIDRFQLVGTRGATTITFRATFHITVGPDGVTALVNRFEMTCH